MNLFKRRIGAYRMARAFGRGRLVSAWLQLRMWATGSTGRYRIRLHP